LVPFLCVFVSTLVVFGKWSKKEILRLKWLAVKDIRGQNVPTYIFVINLPASKTYKLLPKRKTNGGHRALFRYNAH